MDINHHEIVFCLRPCNFFKQHIHVPAAEYSGRVLRRPFGIRIIHPLYLRCGKERDLHIACYKGNRLYGFFQVPAGPHIGHAYGLQRIQRIREGYLSIVIGMIIGKRYQIRTHINQI